MQAYKQYIAVLDSQSSIEKKTAIANLETKREVELKEKQIRIDELEVEKRKTRSVYYLVCIGLLACAMALAIFAYLQKRKDNGLIRKIVDEQEVTIQKRTAELAESNAKLVHANKKLVELIQYNAHNLREPLTRVMGAMVIQEYISADEFYADIWPQMKKAVSDLDDSIKQVISIADETVDLYG